MQRAAVDHQGRHHRNLALGQRRDKGMLFQDRRIRPACGAIKLGDQGRAVFHARLIDAVLITVERQQTPIAAQPDAVQRIEHGIGSKRGEGLGAHGRIVRQASPVHDESCSIMKCICSKSKACLLFGATRLIRHACRKAIDIVTLASEYIVCLSWQYHLLYADAGTDQSTQSAGNIRIFFVLGSTRPLFRRGIMSLLFSKATLGSLPLQNHLVMAPMTRNRATGNIPNELMAQYYAQRATAGLIITEGTSPSPNGLGYPRIPGIFSAEQIAGWKLVTDAVHAKGAKIFMQFMHCGRIGHPLNLPAGARILAPSAVAAAGEMYTDAEGMKPNATPQAMTEADIKATIEEFAQGAKNAMAAGFDGIELHGANGYLLEQFIRPNSNQRTDRYGGPIENRARFVLDVAEAVIVAIGKDKIGIRLSPFGVFNDMPLYDAMEADYTWLAQQLNARGLVYIHLVDHSALGAPPVPG